MRLKVALFKKNRCILSPTALREDEERNHQLHIEGDLCPHCHAMVKEHYGGSVLHVPVEQIALSEQTGVGISSLNLFDPENQTIEKLIGTFLHDQTYQRIGALPAGNRGIVELPGLLNAPKDLMNPLLTFGGEGTIKTPRSSLTDLDTTVITHTSEQDLDRFKSKRTNEAFKDRMFMVRI